MAADSLIALNTFLVNSFSDVYEQLANAITNSTATFSTGDTNIWDDGLKLIKMVVGAEVGRRDERSCGFCSPAW